MDMRNLTLPLLAFAGGAVLGRLLGLKTLARGAMTAAAFTGMASRPALVDLARETIGTPARRRGAQRPVRHARKRVTQKRSRPV
jgi:hypothetical protein